MRALLQVLLVDPEGRPIPLSATGFHSAFRRIRDKLAASGELRQIAGWFSESWWAGERGEGSRRTRGDRVSDAQGVMRCSARTCPEYAPTWARDTRRRLFVNPEQLKLSVMFSVTAPGADLYPFDPRFCSSGWQQRRCSQLVAVFRRERA